MAVYMTTDALEEPHALCYTTSAEKSFVEIRQDVDPLLAKRLGIDLSRPLRTDEFANLLSGLRTDGLSIAGKQVQSESKSLAAILDLATDRLPTIEEVGHIFDGRRADGRHLEEKWVETARKRFLEALGVPRTAKQNEIEVLDHHPSITPERPLIGALASLVVNGNIGYGEANDLAARAYLKRVGDISTEIEDKLGDAISDITFKMESGESNQRFKVDLNTYKERITETKAPIAFVDLSFHPDKSVSVAYALAKTPAERSIYHLAVASAAEDVMRHVEKELGFVKRGKAGSGGTEPGNLVWAKVMHDTSRPVLETIERDAQGHEYTEFHPVPRVADPHLHPHVLLLNAVLTEAGHVGSFDLDGMQGKVKQWGALFHVHLAQRLREHGCSVRLDGQSGAAVLSTVPRELCREFSKRTTDAHAAATEFAKQIGLDWDALPKKRQLALLRSHMERRRQHKISPKGNFADWNEQAKNVSPNYRSPLGRKQDFSQLNQDRRVELAVNTAEQLIAKRFTRDAVISEGELREMLIRGFVETGIGNAQHDIEKAVDHVQTNGIHINGVRTKLIFGYDSQVRGKTFRSVTTALGVEQEQETINLATKLSADHSIALPQASIDKHVAEHAKSLPEGKNYSEEQHKVIDLFATGGRLEIAIGVAGVGKTTLLKPLVSAWKETDRDVHGIALNWSHATALTSAGINYDHCRALDKFLHDFKKDKIKLGHNSVVVVDEIARVGVRQFLDLLHMQDKTGCKVVALGDPRQCASVEAGDIIDLVGKSLPHAVPKMLYSARHKTEREREITALFRKGEEIPRALAMKQEDKTVRLVAGGLKPTVDAIASLWAERVAANKHDPDFTITISAPTNAEARLISEAIRRKRQELGEVAPDHFTIHAVDKNTKETFDLKLSVGDKVRLFDRVFDARLKGPRQALGSNGDVVEVLEITPDRGMLIRNADGQEGFIEWNKLRAGRKEPVRLTLGYALTIDTIQGVTSQEHISAYVSGTASAPLRKHYTALSRQRDYNWLVINESAERQQIAKKTPWRDAPPIIRESDVWQNVARNMGRWVEKSGSLAFLEKATVHARDGSALHGLDYVQQLNKEDLQQTNLVRRAVQQMRQSVHPKEEQRVTQTQRLVQKI